MRALAITGTPALALGIIDVLMDGFSSSWQEIVVLALCFAIAFPAIVYYYTWRERRLREGYLQDRLPRGGTTSSWLPFSLYAL